MFFCIWTSPRQIGSELGSKWGCVCFTGISAFGVVGVFNAADASRDFQDVFSQTSVESYWNISFHMTRILVCVFGGILLLLKFLPFSEL